MHKLSTRQQNILSFISKFQFENGYPPTVREIAEAVGLASSSTAHGHLERLEKKGLIRRDPTKPRTIELVKTAEEKDIYSFFSGLSDTTLHLVQDDAMKESRIGSGDIVIVRHGSVEDGEIALVSVGGSKMVRRLYSNGKQYMLEADAKNEGPIITSQIEVIGKVVGVLHWFGDATFNI
jgi:repressor LexA